MNQQYLKAAGIDYEEGVHRFVGSTALYEKYLLKFFTDAPLTPLARALDAGDYPTAFLAAHDLKGTSGNLSLHAVYNSICPLVEALRPPRHNVDPLPLFHAVQTCYETAAHAVAEEVG